MKTASPPDRCLVGAYWRNRAETAGEAARAIAEFYRDARTLHPLLREMVVVTGDQRHLPLIGRPSSDAAVILSAMDDQARLYSDRSGARIPFGVNALYPSGFSTGLYHLEENSSNGMDFMLTIGSAHPSLSNVVVLTLPVGMKVDEPWVQTMLRLMVRHWDPEWAVLTSDDFRDAVEDERTNAHVGWLSYFSDFSDPPALDVYSIERDGAGAYVHLVETPASDFDADVRRAIAMRKKLVSANVLNQS